MNPEEKNQALDSLLEELDTAHGALVEARKQAALAEHKSYGAIGDAIEAVESAIMDLLEDGAEPPELS